jgi:hypothetical protein
MKLLHDAKVNENVHAIDKPSGTPHNDNFTA